MKHLAAICYGVPAGLLIGYGAMWSGDSASPRPAQMFDLIGKPVTIIVWLLKHMLQLTPVGEVQWWFAIHMIYWAFLGGLVFWVLAVLRSKLTGDE